MENWQKTVFNSTLITSAFLNGLQDFVRARAPKLVPIQEDGSTGRTLSHESDDTVTFSKSHVLFGYDNVGSEFEIMVGDVVVGSETGNLGVVTEIDGNSVDVVSIGSKLVSVDDTLSLVGAPADAYVTGSMLQCISQNTTSALAGQTFSIVGDGLSAYDGRIPSGFVSYYPQDTVDSASYMWWSMLASETGMTLIENASWDGSRVSWIIGTTDDTKGKVAYTNERIAELVGAVQIPENIIVFIGSQDFHDSVPIGTLDIDSDVPSVSGEIRQFKPAYAAMLKNIIETYGSSTVFCCTLPQQTYNNVWIHPIKNALGVPLAAYNEAIIDVANWFGCELIRLVVALNASYGVGLRTDVSGMYNIAKAVQHYMIQSASFRRSLVSPVQPLPPELIPR